MNIAVGSAFRNSEHQLENYFRQVRALKDHAGPNHTVRIIAAEGDSTDDTFLQLSVMSYRFDVPIDIRECSHGGPVYGSTESPERFAALTNVGNAILSGVKPTDDVLLYVESDLLWDPHTVGTLIDVVYQQRKGFDIVAPMVLAGPHFYDIFAFRKDGTRFSPFPPYHEGLYHDGITEVDSVGSCLAMRGEVARTVRFPAGQVLPGWCDLARVSGYRIGVLADFHVKHP